MFEPKLNVSFVVSASVGEFQMNTFSVCDIGVSCPLNEHYVTVVVVKTYGEKVIFVHYPIQIVVENFYVIGYIFVA